MLFRESKASIHIIEGLLSSKYSIIYSNCPAQNRVALMSLFIKNVAVLLCLPLFSEYIVFTIFQYGFSSL